MSGAGRRAAGLLFWTLAGLVAAAHVAVLWQSLAVTRLWEDEAFNLTVPLNLLRGLGYASDGTLSGSEVTLFDPRISTGPVVLLPMAVVLAAGADPVVGARCVCAAFFVALLVALGILGRRIGGRWAALCAVAVPLTLNTAASVSPIQGPADILGEIPAAALVAWAVVVLQRRPWLAGVLVGLAVQSKYIALLFVPAFAVAVWLQTPGMPWRARIRRLLPPAAGVLAPTLLVELIAFASLGVAGYAAHVRSTAGFLLSGGQSYAPTTVGEKLVTLAGSWFLPAWLVVAAVLAAVVVVGLAYARLRRQPQRWRELETAASPRDIVGIGVVALVGTALFVAWWAGASHLPLWIRHPSPALFAFVPVFAAFVVAALRIIGARTAVIGGAALTALVAASTAGHLAAAFAPAWETLAQQRAVATRLADLGGDRYAAAWGGPVSIVVLSDAHVGLWDAGAYVAQWPRLLPAGWTDGCAPPRTVIGGYAVCGADSLPPR